MTVFAARILSSSVGAGAGTGGATTCGAGTAADADGSGIVDICAGIGSGGGETLLRLGGRVAFIVFRFISGILAYFDGGRNGGLCRRLAASSSICLSSPESGRPPRFCFRVLIIHYFQNGLWFVT